MNDFFSLDILARWILKFGHITVIMPCVVVGMIFHKRELYAKAACFLLFVMILNTLLKQIFKVPLFPHLGNGYAFPSGHMHAAAAFYGYILYESKNKYVSSLIVTILSLLGWSLVHCNFHDCSHVLGAIGFACIEFAVYHALSSKFSAKTVGLLTLFLAILIMIFLNVIHCIQYHVWLAFYGLLGTEIALLATQQIKTSFFVNVITLVVASVLIYGIYCVFKYLAFSHAYFSCIQFAILPIIVVCVDNMAIKLTKAKYIISK